PRPLSGVPFQLPYDTDTLPLILPGPHIVSTSVPGQVGNPENLVINSTVNSLDVQFDRDMNAGSFTPADILSLVGPGGPISGPFTVTPNPAGTPAALANRVFRIGFPTQTLSGTYSLCIGPNIKSLAGGILGSQLKPG